MDVKQVLEQYFDRPEVLRAITAYASQNHISEDQLTDDRLLEILKDLKLLDPLLNQTESAPNFVTLSEESVTEKTITDWPKLYLAFERARNFTSMTNSAPGSTFYIHVCGFGQRHKIGPYATSAASFILDSTVCFRADPSLLRIKNHVPLELAITIHSKDKVLPSVYATKLIEWRYVLAYGTSKFDIELPQYGFQPSQSAGILSLKLALNPLPRQLVITDRSLVSEIKATNQLKEEVNKKLYAYSSDFWAQYKAVHSSFQQRKVKLYAQTEDKTLVFASKLVTPLFNLRGVDSPNHALRLVSLIRPEQQRLDEQPTAKRLSTIASTNSGTNDDRCHLLCSILLGFGLRAFVCTGLGAQTETSWVITLNKGSATFWDFERCSKYDFYSPKVFSNYRTIHVMYNHSEYYANLQLDDSIAAARFQLKDRTAWKQFDPTFLEESTAFNEQLALSPTTQNQGDTEQQLESDLYVHLREYRRKQKLPFQVDEKLSSIMSTALTSYETEKLTGLGSGQEEFQAALKNYVPSKHTFKAFPTQTHLLDSWMIFQSIKDNPKARDILTAKGENLHYAIRTKVVSYANDVMTVWISLAVRYYRID